MSTSWDKLDNESMYDQAGMAIPVSTDEGETGSSTAPDAASATAEPASTENTTAAKPSPDAEPAKTDAAPATTENKSGTAAATGTTADPAKPQTTTEASLTPEQETEALKKQFGKEGDKGDEWQIRAFRAGQSIQKKLGPIQEHIDRIGSPDRVVRGLDAIEALAEPETPIGDAWLKMTALSSSRATTLHDFLYNETLNSYPDQVTTDLLSEDGKPVTQAEAREALKQFRSGTAGQGAQPQSTSTVDVSKIEVAKPADMDDEEWLDFKEEYPTAYRAMQQQIADAQKAQKASAPVVEPEDPKVKELSSKVQTYEEKERQQEVGKAVAEIVQEGEKLRGEVFSVVDDGLRDLGLVVDPAKKQDARTISLINDTVKSIRDSIEPEFDGPDGPNGIDDWSRCTPEQQENRKLMTKVFDLLAKRDFAAARDYKEILQARVDLVLQRVAKPKVDLFNAAMLQPTNQTRTAAQGSERPEIVGGSASGGMSNGNPNAKTPWLDPAFIREGESKFDAMERYMETHDNLPGR